jgi:small GTP-binding protein
MASHGYDYLFKILLIGESSAEKTQFVDKFIGENCPIRGDFTIKIINIEGKIIKLQIWDTAGQERFRTITKTYYKGAQGLILIFDVTDQNSFINMSRWIKQIEADAVKNLCKVLVGNNCDKQNRVITQEQGKKMADEYGINYFETSVRTNQNVNEVFYFLTQQILKSKEKPSYENPKKPKSSSHCIIY